MFAYLQIVLTSGWRMRGTTLMPGEAQAQALGPNYAGAKKKNMVRTFFFKETNWSAFN